MDKAAQEALQTLASELAGSMEVSLAHSFENAFGPLAREMDVGVLEPRQNRLLELLEALIGQQQRQEQLWSEIAGRTERVAALERDLDQAQEAVARARADLDAAHGSAATLDREVLAARDEIEAGKDAQAGLRRETAVLRTTLADLQRELEQSRAAAQATQARALELEHALREAGQRLETTLAAETASTELREKIATLEGELEQSRAAAEATRATQKLTLDTARTREFQLEQALNATGQQLETALAEKREAEAAGKQAVRQAATLNETGEALQRELEHMRVASETADDTQKTALGVAQTWALDLERALGDAEQRLESALSAKHEAVAAGQKAWRDATALRESLAGLQRELEQTRAAAESANTAQKNDFAVAQARALELESELREARQQLKTALAEKHEAVAAGSQIEREAAGLRQSTTSLQRKLEQSRAASEAANVTHKTALGAAQARALGLERELRDAGQQLKTVLGEKHDAEAAGSQTEREAASLRESLASREQAVVNLETQLHEAAAARKQLEIANIQAALLAQRRRRVPAWIWAAFIGFSVLLAGQGIALYRLWSQRQVVERAALQAPRTQEDSGRAADVSQPPRETAQTASVFNEIEELKQRIASLNTAQTPGQWDSMLQKLDSVPPRHREEMVTALVSIFRKFDAQKRAGAALPVRGEIPFALGAASLPEDNGRQALQIAATILAARANSVLVLGYADDSPQRGGVLTRDEGNVALSRARAMSAARRLIKSGIDPRSVFTLGVGAALTASDAGSHAKNRGVEILAW